MVGFLKENGFPDAHRNVLNSPLGDIGGVPLVLECKDHKSMTLAAWVEQAKVSGAKAGTLCAVVHKRAQKNVSESYVTMPLYEYVRLLAALNA